MGWHLARAVRALGVCALGLVLGLSPAKAADVECRDFQVLVDGKRAGDYQMAIARKDDGTFVVTGKADVHIKYAWGVYTYTYSYSGTEIWHNGRLLSLRSTSNDDGKKFAVVARADGPVLRVYVNGQKHTVRADVWTTSCWRLPPAPYRNHALVLLDADTGKEIVGTLQFVGVNKVTVAGRTTDCAHYRVTGGTNLKLWFDAQERLVRQESQEQGHVYVLELVRVRR